MKAFQNIVTRRVSEGHKWKTLLLCPSLTRRVMIP